MKRRFIQLWLVTGCLLTACAVALCLRAMWVRDAVHLERKWISDSGRRFDESLVLATEGHRFVLYWARYDAVATWALFQDEDDPSFPRPGRRAWHHAEPNDAFTFIRPFPGPLAWRLGFHHAGGAVAGEGEVALSAPGWFLALSAGLLAVLPPSLLHLPTRRRGRRISQGLCPACGYDLRGAAHERCPECGVSAEGPAARV